VRRAAFADGNKISGVIGQAESGNRDYYSSGRPVVSPAGARFRMQVMPETAQDPGYGIRPAQGNSPAEYNRVGEEYWRAMLKEFGGDHAKMLGAYNWGPGNMKNALERYGENWLQAAPAETRAYVRNNLARLRGR